MSDEHPTPEPPMTMVQTLEQRLRDCSSCAERRKLLGEWARALGVLVRGGAPERDEHDAQ